MSRPELSQGRSVPGSHIVFVYGLFALGLDDDLRRVGKVPKVLGGIAESISHHVFHELRVTMGIQYYGPFVPTLQYRIGLGTLGFGDHLKDGFRLDLHPFRQPEGKAGAIALIMGDDGHRCHRWVFQQGILYLELGTAGFHRARAGRHPDRLRADRPADLHPGRCSVRRYLGEEQEVLERGLFICQPDGHEVLGLGLDQSFVCVSVSVQEFLCDGRTHGLEARRRLHDRLVDDLRQDLGVPRKVRTFPACGKIHIDGERGG